MNTAIDAGTHEPDPEFARHLEWQVRTELRRAQRFDALEPAPCSMWRTVRAVAVVAFALALGAGSVVAAQQWRRSREAELVIAGVRMKQRIASARADSIGGECDQLRELVKSGFTTDDELADCEQRAFAAKLELAHLECDAAEVAASAREPNDRIVAPLVAGRDFVRERLELSLAAANRARQRADERVQRAGILFANGVLAEPELAQRRSEARIAAFEVERLDRTLALRARYVAGQLDGARAELEALRITGEISARNAADAVERAQAEATRIAMLAERGFVSDAERRRAESALAQARAAAGLAQLELELVGARQK